MQVISGNEISKELEAQLKQEVDRLKAQGVNLSLTVVLVGDDPASAVYVSRKGKACERLGMGSEIIHLSGGIPADEFYGVIEQLNNDKKVNGILCQLPLPQHIEEGKVIELIKPEKDVDCFHPYNFGRLVAGKPTFMPCTPFGVMQMLKRSHIETRGKSVVVLGRSNIVGRPLSIMLSMKGWDATVTVCHSRTKNLAEVCSQADILIAAIGKPEFVVKDFIKPGAVVIDVGINKVDADNEKGYRIVGDVHYEGISGHAAAASPVPGGVGPMTIMMLMYNTINAARMQNNMPAFEL